MNHVINRLKFGHLGFFVMLPREGLVHVKILPPGHVGILGVLATKILSYLPKLQNGLV